jgi:3',5'-cyclic AMP phosphodiesterase CpdA
MNRAIMFCLFLLLGVAHAADQPFIVEPYIQMGDAPQLSSSDSLVVMWHTADVDQPWDVQVKKPSGNKWSAPVHATLTRVAVRGIEPHRVFRAQLSTLKPGKEFDYRVRRGEGETVFQARAGARKTIHQSYRIAIFGDCSQGTPEQRAVAYQVYQAKPDFVFIPGDIVYTRGLISEYRTKYFPIYNAASASPQTGAPLIRSTLFVAAPGNHDVLNANLTQNPDALAYFLYWSQPLNGPLTRIDDPNAPRFQATDAERKAFLETASSTYPRMANFSFDYGNAHWTVLDADPYVDWTSPALRDWLAKDLASAKSATWRFVGFHHPGFNSSKAHFGDQWMRRLSDVFEAGGVDVVFAGHVHNYQRSYPLRFQAKPVRPEAKNLTDGEWTLDKEFDGVSKTKPHGVIYIVTGAGGAHLYNPEQQDDPASWQAFTNKFVSKINSFTVIDARKRKLTIRQISQDGKELDSFVVTKK